MRRGTEHTTPQNERPWLDHWSGMYLLLVVTMASAAALFVVGVIWRVLRMLVMREE